MKNCLKVVCIYNENVLPYSSLLSVKVSFFCSSIKRLFFLHIIEKKWRKSAISFLRWRPSKSCNTRSKSSHRTTTRLDVPSVRNTAATDGKWYYNISRVFVRFFLIGSLKWHSGSSCDLKFPIKKQKSDRVFIPPLFSPQSKLRPSFSEGWTVEAIDDRSVGKNSRRNQKVRLLPRRLEKNEKRRDQEI